MIRSILGFALFALAVWVAVQVAFGILGTLVGLAITVLWLATIGYLFYLVVRVISPSTAAKMREAIRGRPGNVA
jgi:threonine/homoserine/homoserine lactone efflux protein